MFKISFDEVWNGPSVEDRRVHLRNRSEDQSFNEDLVEPTAMLLMFLSVFYRRNPTRLLCQGTSLTLHLITQVPTNSSYRLYRVSQAALPWINTLSILWTTLPWLYNKWKRIRT